MFGRKETKADAGYGLKEPQSGLRLRIDGHDYTGYLDTPEFMAWWDANKAAFHGDMDAMVAVELTAGFFCAMLGTEQAQRLFNGVPRTLTGYLGLLEYAMEQADEQGLADKLRTPARYSAKRIIG